MSPNMRVHFDQELAELQEQVLVLGSRVGTRSRAACGR